ERGRRGRRARRVHDRRVRGGRLLPRAPGTRHRREPQLPGRPVRAPRLRDRLPHARLRRQARRSAQPLLHLRRHRAARQPRRRDRSRGARRPRLDPGGQGGERMKLAFVVDPLERLKPYKDSSVAMMREAARRGHEVHALEAASMTLREGSVRARTMKLALSDDDHAWYSAAAAEERALASFDVVMMRKDPPFDQEYYYNTLLLEHAQREGARVVNDPRALRDWNEKAAILRFPALIPATLVASRMDEVHAFIDAHADVVVKKLDGMGGAMIFRVRAGDVNRNVIVETITDGGVRTVMAQRFIPEIAR